MKSGNQGPPALTRKNIFGSAVIVRCLVKHVGVFHAQIGYAVGLDQAHWFCEDTPKLGKSSEVWAQLHKDDGLRGVFEWERQAEPLADSAFAFACNSYNELTMASGFADFLRRLSPSSRLRRENAALREQDINAVKILRQHVLGELGSHQTVIDHENFRRHFPPQFDSSTRPPA